MAQHYGTDPSREIDPQMLFRDTRPLPERVIAAVFQPGQYAFVMLAVAVVSVSFPALFLVTVPLVFFSNMGYSSIMKRRALPFKVPKFVQGALDPNEAGNDNKPTPPEGIMFLGNQRPDVFNGKNEEVWISNSDARMHLLDFGTTGAGKTERLLSHVFNALCWGSGFLFVDGKAENTFVHKVFAMARRCGREDDVLILNFMQAGQDAFERKKSTIRDSNTMNPMARGSGDFITNLITSMLAEVSGDSASWREKAVGMLEAVIRTIVYLRFKGEILIDPGTIREFIPLEKVIELSTRQDLPDRIHAQIKSYLDNLPGFSMDEYRKTKKIDPETKRQHDYLSGQFTKLLGSLNDTYGHIFKHQLPEVDMLDVVQNNRILLVLIPSLEKSKVESEGLGRLVVSTLRLMMAITLGARIDGTYEDVVESKITASNSPFQIVLDELGYYFTEGTALMFAQARSCGFSMIASGQDKQAMAKGKNKEEVESVIANTKFKECMALEDPSDTFQVFSQAAGEAIVSQSAGFTATPGGLTPNYQDRMDASLEKRQRITVQELKDLKAGQSLILWKSKIVRMNVFYVFGKLKINKKFRTRINQFIKVPTPKIADMEKQLERPTQENREFNLEFAEQLLKSGQQIDYGIKELPAIAKCLQQASQELRADQDMPAVQRGILLYCRVRQLLSGEPDPIFSDLGVDDVIINAEDIFDDDASFDLNPADEDIPEGNIDILLAEAEEYSEEAARSFEELSRMSFKKEAFDNLVTIERGMGAEDPEKVAREMIEGVAKAIAYKPILPPDQIKTIDEIVELYAALEAELLKDFPQEETD